METPIPVNVPQQQPQPQPQQQMPVKSGMKTFWVVLISVLVSAILFGGGIYYWQSVKAKNDKEALNKQISSLQSQISDLKKTAATSTSTATSTTASTITANWKTYTNPTFGYSIKYPTTWTEKQDNTLDASPTEAQKNMNIEFSNGSTLMLRISTDYISEVGNLTLAQLAADVPTPKDKTTVTGVTNLEIGSLDGIQRLITVSDPASESLQYITKDNTYIYYFNTFNKNQDTNIVNMLSTFTTK